MAERETFKMMDEDTDAERKVALTVGSLSKRAKKRLKNLCGNIQGTDAGRVSTDLFMGDIEDYLITNVVEELTVDGEPVKPVSYPNGRESLYDALPALYDEETGEEIDDRVVALCVKHHPRLASHATFSQVFGRYAAEVGGNPTKRASSQDTSTNSPSDSSSTTATSQSHEDQTGLS